MTRAGERTRARRWTRASDAQPVTVYTDESGEGAPGLNRGRKSCKSRAGNDSLIGWKAETPARKSWKTAVGVSRPRLMNRFDDTIKLAGTRRSRAES